MAERKPASTNKQILEAIQKVDDKVENINKVLVGTAEKNEPGLMERMRRVEDWISAEKKLISLIVVIIITDIVTRLWSLIVK